MKCAVTPTYTQYSRYANAWKCAQDRQKWQKVMETAMPLTGMPHDEDDEQIEYQNGITSSVEQNHLHTWWR